MTAFKFGPYPISASEIFYSTRNVFGLVNLKPVTPGHVLIIPRRVVPRFADLTTAEAHDLVIAAQRVGKVVEREYKGESLTITVQDGPAAGQTVPHVHIHVMPRRKGDWADNDDIYPEINRKEGELGRALKNRVDAEAERKPRSHEEMAEEAGKLRVFFKDVSQAEGGADIWNN
ncbi:HIT-like protein [Rhizoclosmatium globosum]|uniref:HIT-like protein n=1 Tax=Rhizoclosmatium globosum TaxID=329046 RepID=A0A1Y2D540_9FUNG|nr:HIT-like protein [Rhizoclosmatium globosum]|eukprot:ORY53695.1 HIT-like protein [Rhizoclosmatium globosum]